MAFRPVGIESWGVYLPEARHTSAHISEKTGIPVAVLEEKFGIITKAVPGPDDHPVGMAGKAARLAMERAGVTVDDLDLIIWTGDIRAEKLWLTHGIALQQELGCPRKPWAFDISQRCGTTSVAMMVVKGLVQLYPEINTVLLAGGARGSDVISYDKPRTRFLASLGTSAVAMVLKADSTNNEILGVSTKSDGNFADDVYVPAGGTKYPLSREALEQRDNYLDVIDPPGLKKRLDKTSMESFVEVIDDALHQSGLTRKDIDYLSIVHMKRSAFEYVARSVGVEPYEQAVYCDDIGHTGGNDLLISIDRAVAQGKIKDGDIVLTAGAGIGWTWNAGVIRWGKGAGA